MAHFKTQDHAVTTALILANSDTFIRDTSSNPPKPAYSLNTTIDSLTYNSSSLYFSRAWDSKSTGHDSLSTLETNPSVEKEDDRLFNLVHPPNAEYRTDIPAHWFLTCHSPSLSSIGNIKHIASSKSLFSSKADKFKAVHYPGRTASTSPLFPDEEHSSNEDEKVLFTVTKQIFGRGHIWSNSSNKQVAREEEYQDGDVVDGRTLIFTDRLDKEEQDALVAVWALKRWIELVEEKGFRKEALEKLSSAERAHMDMKWSKRVGALGGLAAAGGAC